MFYWFTIIIGIIFLSISVSNPVYKITIKKLNSNLDETSKNLSREEWKKSENTQITFDKENLIDEIKTGVMIEDLPTSS